jgi:predicted protein tyrosine phosphatase
VRALSVYNAFAPTHVISMLDPAIDPLRVPRFPSAASLLQLFFYDDDDLHLQAAPIDPMASIIPFLDDFLAAADPRRLLVHCHMGASRSPAVLYTLLAMRLGRDREDQAFDELLWRAPKPWPSRILVARADEALGRHGRLLAPLDRYRARWPLRYAAYQRLNRRR